jgi:hypothetical protein
VSRAIWPGAWVQTLENVAEAAYEMCQWLDMHRGNQDEGALPEGMLKAHDRLHSSLGPYEAVKYGKEDV